LAEEVRDLADLLVFCKLKEPAKDDEHKEDEIEG
jgi:hypothetical protein